MQVSGVKAITTYAMAMQVSGVKAGSQAEAKGVGAGWVVRSVGGESLRPLGGGAEVVTVKAITTQRDCPVGARCGTVGKLSADSVVSSFGAPIPPRDRHAVGDGRCVPKSSYCRSACLEACCSPKAPAGSCGPSAAPMLDTGHI